MAPQPLKGKDLHYTSISRRYGPRRMVTVLSKKDCEALKVLDIDPCFVPLERVKGYIAATLGPHPQRITKSKKVEIQTRSSRAPLAPAPLLENGNKPVVAVAAPVVNSEGKQDVSAAAPPPPQSNSLVARTKVSNKRGKNYQVSQNQKSISAAGENLQEVVPVPSFRLVDTNYVRPLPRKSHRRKDTTSPSDDEDVSTVAFRRRHAPLEQEEKQSYQEYLRRKNKNLKRRMQAAEERAHSKRRSKCGKGKRRGKKGKSDKIPDPDPEYILISSDVSIFGQFLPVIDQP